MGEILQFTSWLHRSGGQDVPPRSLEKAISFRRLDRSILRFGERLEAMGWAEEKGQISAGVAALDRRQRDRQAFCYREQFPTRGDKAVRARAQPSRMKGTRTAYSSSSELKIAQAWHGQFMRDPATCTVLRVLRPGFESEFITFSSHDTRLRRRASHFYAVLRASRMSRSFS